MNVTWALVQKKKVLPPVFPKKSKRKGKKVKEKVTSVTWTSTDKPRPTWPPQPRGQQKKGRASREQRRAGRAAGRGRWASLPEKKKGHQRGGPR